MRKLTVLPLAALALLAAPAAAQAFFVHVIAPGESLTSVAVQDGLSIAQLAAANGMSPNAELISGAPLVIPPQNSTAVAPATGAPAVGDGDADGDDPGAAAAPAAAPASFTAYIVQPGDTLTAIAARAGVSVAQLAAANGLDPNGILLSGSTLHLGGGGTYVASSSAATSQPVGAAAQGSSSAPPYPTPEFVTSGQVASIAAANGVPPSLADAIAYQESGFNNNLVSSADARGVMQITPGTWDWIGQTLAGPAPLAPASAVDNIRGGVLLLRSLLNATGGNEALAAAGYYQGLPSVLRNGEYSDTQQYVNDIQALQGRFGG
jgi:LysM repeat protein